MSRKVLLQVIVGILVLTNTAVLAMLWYKQKGFNDKPPTGMAKDYLVKELKLTEQQQAQFETLRKAHFEKMMQLRKETRELKDELFDNVSNAAIDSTNLKKLAEEIASKESGRDLATVYHFREVRKILTSQQQEKFDEIIHDVIRMMGRPGGGPGMQRPPGGGEGRPHDMPPPGEGPPHDGPPGEHPPGEGPPPGRQ